MDRRQFLKMTALAGLAVSGPLGVARSARADEPYSGLFFVNVNASGGWDPTSFCDPKGQINEEEENPMNRSYFRDDIETAGNIPYAPVGYASTFFGKYSSRLLVLNGVDTATNGHDSGSRNTWSGQLAEGYPAFGALVASAKARSLPMAFISNGGYDLTQGLVAPTRAGNTSALQRIAFPDRMDPNNPDYLFHTEDTLARIRGSQQARLEAARTRLGLGRRKKSMGTLYTARVGENIIKRLTDNLPETLDNSNNPLRRQAQLAIAAYKAGLCVSANLSVGGFDTHGNHDATHIPRLTRYLEGVDFLMEEAERQGVADRMVVTCGSDFGRTPGYNANDGKDHWSITSMMLMGPGIRGNRVVGATTERHTPLKVNAQSLALDESGMRITPGHVHANLRKLAGIEESEQAAMFPLRVEDVDLFS